VVQQDYDVVNVRDGLDQRVFRQLTALCDIQDLRQTLIYILH
jgi:hypothetical protein